MSTDDDVKITIESKNPLAMSFASAVMQDAFKDKGFVNVVTTDAQGVETKIIHSESIYDMVQQYAPNLFQAKVSIQHGVPEKETAESMVERFNEAALEELKRLQAEAAAERPAPRPSVAKMCAPTKEEVKRAMDMIAEVRGAQEAQRRLREQEQSRMAKKTHETVHFLMTQAF